MDTNKYLVAIRLFSVDALNVNDKLLPVNLYHFANLLALVMSPHHLHKKTC